MTPQRFGLPALLIALIGLLLVDVGAARATSVQFLPSIYAAGFDATPGFPTTASYVIPSNAPFVSAGSGPGESVSYTLQQCLLLNGAGDCQPPLPQGSDPYVSIATLTLTSVTQPIPQDGILLFLSGLGTNPVAYNEDEVAVETSAGSIAGQSYGGLETIVWTSTAGNTYYYLGVRMYAIGDSLTLRYDVDYQRLGGTPVIETNVVYNFVPEPSTALLLALGLGGLAIRRQR